MRGLSRDALAAVEERFNAVAATADLPRLAEELNAVADLLDREHGLRRALTDPARPPEQKAQVAQILLEGKVGDATLETVLAGVQTRWTRAGDLADAMERLGIVAAAAAAEDEGRLRDVEDELFRFGRIVEGSPELRRFLTDTGVPASRKEELLDSLLAGKTTAMSLLLIKQVVARPRGRSLERGLEEYGNLVADRQRRLVAVVRSAVALTEEQKERLAGWLRSSYGRDVHLNAEVDPKVIGGFSVRIGDELIDTTIAGRIEEVRRRLAG